MPADEWSPAPTRAPRGIPQPPGTGATAGASRAAAAGAPPPPPLAGNIPPPTPNLQYMMNSSDELPTAVKSTSIPGDYLF